MTRREHNEDACEQEKPILYLKRGHHKGTNTVSLIPKKRDNIYKDNIPNRRSERETELLQT